MARLLADERVRFVLVGGVNTVLGYGLFAAFYFSLGATIGYIGSLYASYAVAIVVAFVLHRRFTFRVNGTGNPAVDFLRISGVHAVALVVNTIALPVLVEYAQLDPLPAQALIVMVTTLISYFGHKVFSFRRASPRLPRGIHGLDHGGGEGQNRRVDDGVGTPH
ncbi:putative flippase GtrA [Glaciihabitans tibetensis]|uniref:Putative flippase GtrA n=1 Tax=Glaciihabitans tibetensis TaxID=1266600 RepID=A0A2T0VFF3_9MICO|nr:putative flippase GtrA [Glaciihabitans tibetensis]